MSYRIEGSRRSSRVHGVRVALLLAGLVGAAAGGCRPRQPVRVVLVTVDSLDDGTLAAMPRLLRRARGGTLFERFYGVAPETRPAIASMLTGLYPWDRGLGKGGSIPASTATIAEVLAERGFATGAAVASPDLGRRAGFARGFSSYRAGRADAREETEGALGLLDRIPAGDPASRRQFFWFHYAGPPDSGLDSSQLPAEEAIDLDRELDRLLARLAGRGDPVETRVVLAAAHGTGRISREGRSLVEARLRAPLILFSPGAAPGERRDVASSVDVARTVLWLAGLRYPAPVFARGRNLAAWAPAPWLDPQATAALRIGALGLVAGPPSRRFFAVDRAGRVFTGDASGISTRPPGASPGDEDAARALFRHLAVRNQHLTTTPRSPTA